MNSTAKTRQLRKNPYPGSKVKRGPKIERWKLMIKSMNPMNGIARTDKMKPIIAVAFICFISKTKAIRLIRISGA